MNVPQTTRLARWYHLLCHHRTDQLWHRARRIAVGWLWAPSLSHEESQLAATAGVDIELGALRTLGLRRATREHRGKMELSIPEFQFQGELRSFAWPIDWRCTSVAPVSLHWRFEWHSQDALWSLANPTQPQFELLWKHVVDWAVAHEFPTRQSSQDGWHPFCLSRRLANWLQWWSLSPPPEEDRERVLRSAARQAAYLSSHLEWDLRGNHLLFNLWALGLAAAFFDGELRDHCLAPIDAYLSEQIEEQILETGEHFERAVAYHVEVAELLLDLREVLRPVRPRLAAQCGATASQMTDLVVGISHPDGDPPLFGDSTLRVRPILDDLKRTLVNSLESPSMREARARVWGDYWVWRQGDDCLIFDTGPVGADELPAHAHGDLFGFEASLGGQKLFVDSGVASYSDDKVRQYCRSTAAHNTLEIDGVSQCDVWGKFRMGYRGHPLDLEDGPQVGHWWCQATHNAYRRLGVPGVTRHLECHEDGTWRCRDVLWGEGEHQIVSRLHLHPNVRVIELTTPIVILEVGSRRVRIVFAGSGGTLTTSPGMYCPEFGQVVPITVLEYRRQTKVPAVVEWTLTREREGSSPQAA